MRRFILILPVMGAIVIFSAAVALAQATTTTEVLLQGTGFGFTNPCTGEYVEVNDPASRVVIHTTIDAQGGTHAQVIYPVNATGVGESGIKYRLTAVGKDRYHNVEIGGTVGTPPYSFTFERNLLVNAEGSADNFQERQLVHVTVNANGEATAEYIELESRCLG